MKIFRYLALSVLLAMNASGATAQDFDKGWAAYIVGDYQTAWEELMPLAEGGDANAQAFIGLMYIQRNGVLHQDDVEAVKWLRLAADQGQKLAQGELALMYEKGEGVLQNNVLAHMWYNISSANGMSYASKRRDEIALKMTREDISKAQAMAQDCISSGYKNCGD